VRRRRRPSRPAKAWAGCGAARRWRSRGAQGSHSLGWGCIQITGRDLFLYRPELFVDDEDAGGVDTYIKTVTDEELAQDEDGALVRRLPQGLVTGYLLTRDGPRSGGSTSATTVAWWRWMRPCLPARTWPTLT
jgi:hypothetical protein